MANHGTAVDPATGNIYVVNPNNDRIEVFDQTGVAVPNPDGHRAVPLRIERHAARAVP